jgi:hypothetical protein
MKDKILKHVIIGQIGLENSGMDMQQMAERSAGVAATMNKQDRNTKRQVAKSNPRRNCRDTSQKIMERQKKNEN